MNDAVRISEISTYVRDKAFILGIFNVLSESRLKFEFHDKMRCYFQGFAVASFGYHTFFGGILRHFFSSRPYTAS